jgi:hypothetical protein
VKRKHFTHWAAKNEIRPRAGTPANGGERTR